MADNVIYEGVLPAASLPITGDVDVRVVQGGVSSRTPANALPASTAVQNALATKANASLSNVANADLLAKGKAAGLLAYSSLPALTPEGYGAGTTGDDTAAFLAFLAACDQQQRPGVIGNLNLNSAAYTATGNLMLTCVGKITNLAGAAATGPMVKLTGTQTTSIVWDGGVLDGANGPNSIIHFLNWLHGTVHVDQAYGIIASPASSNSTSAILMDNVTNVSLTFGELFDMDKGGNTQGSVPRGVTLQATAMDACNVTGGLIHHGHGAFVIGDTGASDVNISGVAIQDMDDNGVYNVGNTRRVNLNGVTMLRAEEPLVCTGVGTIYMTGGSLIDCTNAIGLGGTGHGGGGVSLKSVFVRPAAGQNIVRTRTGNLVTDIFAAEDCYLECTPRFEAVSIGIGEVSRFVDKNNTWVINLDPATIQTPNLFTWNTGQSFFSDGSTYALRVTGAGLPDGDRYLIMPATITGQSEWHSRLFNETGNANVTMRITNMRQQTITFSNMQSVVNISAEVPINNADPTIAPPREVWGPIFPSFGYWPPGSDMKNTAPVKGGPSGWSRPTNSTTWVQNGLLKNFISGAKTITWGTLAPGTTVTTDLVVTGAVAGDQLWGLSYNQPLGGFAFLTWEMQDVGMFKVKLQNPANSIPITPTAGGSLRGTAGQI